MSPEIKEILERLTRLENENRTLLQEVHALREQLNSSGEPAPAAAEPGQDAQGAVPGAAAASADVQPPIQERVNVLEQRVEEQAQTKVEASQKMPVKLTGTLLFNAFSNGRYSGDNQYPTIAQPASGLTSTGASFRQSVIGLQFNGPEWVGAKLGGTVYADFFAGSSASLNHLVRLRVATFDMAWKNTTLTFGQDKPIISPREPNSIAQMGVSPLTGAGNLWLWQPQARIEQRISFGESAGLTAAVGLYQTSETSNPIPTQFSQYTNTLAHGRPGYEGRFNFWKDFGSGRRIEIAPGFHFSSSHVDGISVPSDIYSMDWLIAPISKVKLTGMFFAGRNVAGLGSLRQGYSFFDDGQIVAIGARAAGRISRSWPRRVSHSTSMEAKKTTRRAT